MSDVTEVVVGKGVEELDALIAAAKAEKENAKQNALNELNELAAQFKQKCESVGVKAKSYFIDTVAKPSLTYANPANPAETYSKGPRPQWLKDALAGIEDKKAQKAKMAEFLVG